LRLPRLAFVCGCFVLSCAYAGVVSAQEVVEDEAPRSEKPARSKKPKVSEEKVVLEEEDAESDSGVILEEDEQAKPKEESEEAPAPEPKSDGKKESRAAWLQLGLVQDFTVVSGAEVCSPESQIEGRFTCIRQSGSQYHGTPLPGEAGKASSFAVGPTRITLAAAFPLGGSFSAGLRVGYAFLGQGPTPDGGKKFLPLLVEAQGHYWFTGNAFSTDDFGVFAILSGGIAQVDGKATVTVSENTAVPPPVSQLDNPPVQRLDAWHKSGVGFAAAGIGAFLPVSGRFGLLADLKASVLFPTPGFALGVGVSAAFGL
jgi:hypothetical protein